MKEESIKVMSWNVEESANSSGRIDSQIEYINDVDPDILCLQAVKHSQSSDASQPDKKWIDDWLDKTKGLPSQGYDSIHHSYKWAEHLGKSKIYPHHQQRTEHIKVNITATKKESKLIQPLYPDDSDQLSTIYKNIDLLFPEKILIVEVNQSLNIWNVGIPMGGANNNDNTGGGFGEEKVKAFEYVARGVQQELDSDKQVILCGDFNAPCKEIMENEEVKTIPWGSLKDNGGSIKPAYLRSRWPKAELSIFEGLQDEGLVNVFKQFCQNQKDDYLDSDNQYKDRCFSHPIEGKPTPKAKRQRIDHIFCPELWRIEDCYYETDKIRVKHDEYDYSYDGKILSDHAPVISKMEMED